MKNTEFTSPTLSDVYQKAISFREAQPWKWMSDSDIFAVQSPISGKIAYCCIMGNAKFVYALGIYDDLDGIRSLLNLRDSHDGTEVDQLRAGLEQHLYKVSFEDREFITADDKKVYKKLGLKFRGANQWIQITRWLPGYFPQTVSGDIDLDLIGYALDQSLVVLERFKKNPSLIQRADDKLLLLVPGTINGQLTWSDEYISLPTLDTNEAPVLEKMELQQEAKKELPYQQAALCFVLQYMPNPIGGSDEETHPYFSKISIWMAYKSAEILGFDLYSPKTYDRDFAKDFYGKLHDLGFIPTQILVNSKMALHAIRAVTKSLKTEVIFAPEVKDFQILEEEFLTPFINMQG